jgi:hypothetical protein
MEIARPIPKRGLAAKTAVDDEREGPIAGSRNTTIN